MTEELKLKIKNLQEQVNILTEKTNEIVECLDDNELSVKVKIDPIETEEEENTS